MTGDAVPTLYQFEVFRAATRDAEVWAVSVPVCDLRPEDAGALVSIEWHPLEIAASFRRWGHLQRVEQVPAGRPGRRDEGTRSRTFLWVDGVCHGFDRPMTEVWIGYSPFGPEHMSRGGFTR